MTTNSGLWFLTGLAAGAAAGILFAPYAGAEIRDLIGRKADEGKSVLARQGLRLKKQAVAARDRASDLLEQGGDAMNKEKDRLASAIDSGVSTYKAAPAFSGTRKG
jgi:gas vesicle protein